MNFSWDRSPIAGEPISAVLPAYQVEQQLPAVVDALAGCLDKRHRDYEIIVVNDGSTDGTQTVAQGLAARHSGIQYLEHLQSEGYGAALRTGVEASRYPLLVTMPADGSYQPEELVELLKLIDKVDIVLGYRQPRPWLKTQRQSWLAFFGFGLWFKDPACHFRLYRREVFKRIPIQSRGCFADVEILAKATFCERLITETAVTWKPPAVAASPISSSFSDALRVFRQPDFGPAQIDDRTEVAATSQSV